MTKNLQIGFMLALALLGERSLTAAQPERMGKHQYIIVLKEDSKTRPAKPDAAALAHVGGQIDGESPGRMYVTLPDQAVEAMRAHGSVKYLQRIAMPEDPTVWPAETAEAAQPQRNGSAPSAIGADSLHVAPQSAGVMWQSGEYRYDGSGNITAIGSTSYPASSGAANTYTYDTLSRLVTASVSSRGVTRSEAYTYDVYGNMKQRVSGPDTFVFPIDPKTNRLTGGATSYDQAGNLTTYGAERYFFDPINMMTKKQANDSGGGIEKYVYDASDERIGVTDGTYWQWTLRDFEGKVVRKYSSPYVANMPANQNDGPYQWLWVEDYYHRGSQLLAATRPLEQGGTRHFHLDHLGTPRLVTSFNGAQITESHDYAPFGTELTPLRQATANGFDREDAAKFTGHERDFTSGTQIENTNYLDYMHARYYSPGVGRFLSLDPVLESEKALKEPQRWNRYAYVMNNPMNHTDPTGKVVEIDANADIRRLKIFLAETMRRPTGRADVMAVINDPNHKLRMTSGTLTGRAQIQIDMRNHGSANITFGQTVPNGNVQLQPNGSGTFVVTGSTMTIDTNAVSQHHSDRSGVTTTAHEFDHVNDLRGGGVTQMKQGDFPTSATGPAEQHGQSVASERPDMTAAQARALVDQLIPVRP